MAGDPANQSINKLTRRGFAYIVLPRLTYMTGTLVEDVPTDLPIVRQVRLADCLTVLRGDA